MNTEFAKIRGIIKWHECCGYRNPIVTGRNPIVTGRNPIVTGRNPIVTGRCRICKCSDSKTLQISVFISSLRVFRTLRQTPPIKPGGL